MKAAFFPWGFGSVLLKVAVQVTLRLASSLPAGVCRCPETMLRLWPFGCKMKITDSMQGCLGGFPRLAERAFAQPFEPVS